MTELLKIPLLYVDDEKVNLLAFRANFRRNYEVFTASSGEEGKKLLEEHNIKVVVADQRMPKMTGVEFFEWIQEDHPDTVRILLTGFADISAVIDAINKGKIYSYVTKPWHEDELRQTFEGGIEQSQRNIALRNLEVCYTHLFQHTTDAVFTIDQFGKIINVNNAATKLFDYSADEIRSIHLDQLFDGFESLEKLVSDSGKKDQLIYNKFRAPITCTLYAMAIKVKGNSEGSVQVILQQN
jgi:response regulator RpfG family c-di-GMP phosphodiesterase